jgi:hypothetical protein
MDAISIKRIKAMKNLIMIVVMASLLASICFAENTNLFEKTNDLPVTNGTDFTAGQEAGLVSFFPDVHLSSINEMLKTNGVGCLISVKDVPFEYDSNTKPPKVLAPPVCWASVFNHSTDYIGCLNMPATNLCKITLLDKQGHQVQKTKLGEAYGGTLSQEEIEAWHHHWDYPHRRMLIRLLPNGIRKFTDTPTGICFFGIKEAFEIKDAGEYELRVQVRLVQIAKDGSGKLHYLAAWLPEVTAKVDIQP